MLGILGLSHFLTRREPTYTILTREFLSSFSYTIIPNSASTLGTVKFRMFNWEYEYSLDAKADLFHFSRGNGVVCEAPIDTEWVHEVVPFWQQLTGYYTNTFEGNLASMIHNLNIRYFCQMLACTIFWLGKF